MCTVTALAKGKITRPLHNLEQYDIQRHHTKFFCNCVQVILQSIPRYEHENMAATKEK